MSAFIFGADGSATEKITDHPDSIKYLQRPIHPSVSSNIKRLLDIIGAVIGLIITAFFFIPIACITAISDRGPIFYSQIRCGLNGKTFRIWKFRSMVVNAETLSQK
jgi:lipopolysaccharide/colanic/teichoic acid biosynthesis glycosyltransferase